MFNENIQKINVTGLKPLPNGLFIIGRRWFQRSYGNTYHTFEIKDVYNQKTLYMSDIEYGYGEQYLQGAHEWLKANGYDVPEEYYNFKMLPGVQHMATDVSTKKEL